MSAGPTYVMSYSPHHSMAWHGHMYLICTCYNNRFEYLWADGVKVKKPIKVSAPEYVDLLMSWVETQLNDEHIFPLQLGNYYHCSSPSLSLCDYINYYGC
jgi:hypothetical protein